MNLKRNITFQLERRKKNGILIDENVPIRMRVVFDGKRIEFTTGYRIDRNKWDEENGRVKKGCSNKLKQSFSEINADLNRYEAIIHDIFKEYELQSVMPTVDDVKTIFNSRIAIKKTEITETEEIKKEPQKSFWEIYDEFTKECGRQNDWTAATKQKFKALKNHLLRFKKLQSFEYLNEKGLNDIVEFFRNKYNMLNSTIGKQLGYLKWFLKWAANKGYHNNMAYASFSPKLKNTQAKVIFLTDEELEQIKTYQIPEPKKYLERVRDVLIFCCYTGLRYSDVANLRKSDVKENHIEVTTVKTQDSLIIELNKHSKAILKKYEDVEFEGSKVLPVISNQKMNEYIKELGKLAKIETPVRITQYKGHERIDSIYPKYELLSTHTGRKTFICKALSLGIPPNVVMKWTGHSDYKAMKPYIDIDDSIKVNSMALFDL
ncbi:MAG: tyrosine-type recombinase/integrase [Muribaculaceae bacterium]|nr:tyrosine-type recombinase/integrase [Muribaculaceae bacterium]